MQRRFALGLLLATPACLTVELDNRACPCIDGYVCVDDVCVSNNGLDDACPAAFNDADACAAVPPAAATLVAVCAQGDTFEEELVEASEGAFGTCFGPPVSAQLVSESLTGNFTYDGDALHITVSGSTRWDVAVPDSCVIEAIGCDATGTCVAADNGCACNGLTANIAIDDVLEQSDVRWLGDGTWRACGEGDVFTLRRQEGTARGLTLVFRAD
jgi:hypothetical protein